MNEWRKWNRRFIITTLDLQTILAQDHYQALLAFAVGAGSNCGHTLMAILTTINFIASLSGMKVSMGRFKVDLNTFTVVVGPTGTGKSPTASNYIKVRLGKMGRGLANHIIDVPTVNSLMTNLAENGTAYFDCIQICF